MKKTIFNLELHEGECTNNTNKASSELILISEDDLTEAHRSALGLVKTKPQQA